MYLVNLQLIGLCQNFEVTDLLIKMGSNLNDNDQESYVSYSPLMTAALFGRKQKRRQRKAHNFGFNMIDLKSNDFFLLGNEKIAKLLLDNGADMYIKSTLGATARTIAQSEGMIFQKRKYNEISKIFQWFFKVTGRS